MDGSLFPIDVLEEHCIHCQVRPFVFNIRFFEVYEHTARTFCTESVSFVLLSHMIVLQSLVASLEENVRLLVSGKPEIILPKLVWRKRRLR